MKKNKKSENMVINNTKIYQKIKNKSLLSIEKNIVKSEKTRCYDYKKELFFKKVMTWKSFLMENRSKLNISFKKSILEL